jgi:hypothetical protein
MLPQGRYSGKRFHQLIPIRLLNESALRKNYNSRVHKDRKMICPREIITNATLMVLIKKALE